MKNTHHILSVLFVIGALTLAACGSPTPIAVYVTPTHADPSPESAAALPEPSPTSPPIQVVEAQATPAVTAETSTPFPTPYIPPGVTYGPIVGPAHTLEPLHTALPLNLTERPCPAIIAVPQATLYDAPRRDANAIGTALERANLPVSQVITGADGATWANTSGGWLMLSDPAAVYATLGQVRACNILLGTDPDTTLMGLHLINGNSSREVLRLVRLLAQSGHPMGSVKGVSGAETVLNEIKAASPETVVIFRSLRNNERDQDCPSKDLAPEESARQWMAGLESQWSRVNADYYEIMNECSGPWDWMARFGIEAMRIANEQGRCLLLYSFAGGQPEPWEFDQLRPAFEYALANECQPGRTHGWALHAHSLADDVLVSESDVWIVFRHRIFYERLVKALPEAARLPVYVTEMGIGGGTIMPACNTITRDAIQYTYQLEGDPYVKGFHLWSVGSGAQWFDITPCLGQIGDSLLAYYGE
ncbi:MAG: hypothetical protein JW910_08140 [Anaerolineae bacterium]|nr:hypothetical protein [Anaerolineae bacterium]